jgi:dihydroxyacetone kinase
MDWRAFGESLRSFAEQNKKTWNELDSAQGDGDLGVTIELAANAMADAAKTSQSLQQWLQDGGKSLRKAAPSTMGILLASALIAAGKSLSPDNNSPSMQEWLEIQKTMAEEIQRRGSAQLGDKTMLDAFLPAIDAFAKGVAENLPPAELMSQTAGVAKHSAEATASMVSRIGRSSWLGERASGHIDGGAWFCYQLYDWISKQLLDKA